MHRISSQKEGLYAGLAALMAAILLFVFRSGTLSVDSLEYAMHVMTGDNMWHPHHLLYCPVGHVLYKVAGSPDVIVFMQLHGALWAGLGLFLLYRVLRQHEVAIVPSAAATAALLFSYGFWTFSTMIEVYVPGIALLLGAWLCLTGAPDRGPGTGRILLFALLFSLAVGYHQTHIFLAPAALLYVWIRWKPFPWRPVALGATAGMAGVILMYLLGAYLTRGSLEMEEIKDYLFYYQLHGSAEWGSSSNLSAKGLLQLSQSQVSAWIGAFYGKLAISYILGLLALLYILVTAWLQRHYGPARLRAARGALLLWFGISYLFFWWWLPSEGEFFLLPLTLLILLAMLPGPMDLSKGKWRQRIALILVAGALALNFPHHFIQPFYTDPSEIKGKAMHETVDKDCVILTDYDAAQWVKFIGGRVRARHVGYYIEAIRAGAEPESLSKKAQSCRVVDLSYFRPDFRYLKHELKKEPETWIRLVRHLLNIRMQHGRVFSDQFELIQPGGVPCLRIWNEDRIFADEISILLELAEIGEPHSPGMKAAMQAFLHPDPEAQ